MRLDRFCAHMTGLSRAQVKQAVRRGRISVNGRLAEAADQHIDPVADEIALDAQPVRFVEHLYLMLHKPSGYVCSTSDPDGPTVLELLPPELARREPFTIGRLDRDATGLVLLTTDGAFAHRLSSGKGDVAKRYRIDLESALEASVVAEWKRGLRLAGEDKPLRPVEAESVGDRAYVITLREGRYHQIKRMAAAAGNGVRAIHRLAIGPFELDRELKPGQYRFLTEEELGWCRTGAIVADDS